MMKTRKPIIAGNWKMFKTINEANELIVGLKRELSNIEFADIIVCPPFTLLNYISDMLQESNIVLGAQDLFWEEEGAFTGEISANMLKDAGCSYVIIGHSERRQFFGETNDTVNKKIFSAFKNGLIPIACIGENLSEREKNLTFKVIQGQLEGSLKNLSPEDCQDIILAYEPVWAIGTGKVATPAQAQEVHNFIRDWLAKAYSPDVAQKVRIQYGGSVKPDNISGLLANEDIDGALVGGASLKVESFAAIVKNSKL